MDLGRFDPKLKGRRITGRLKANRLGPYPDRAEIDSSAFLRWVISRPYT